tara:strand:+ start:1465 stop:2511 length:1047 start_codon:yes stop_codon:yes gene_type:complete
MSIKINRKISISNNTAPIIVAEISGNHCGKKSLLLKHIKIAAKSGADMVKIQTYEPSDITIKQKNKKFIIKKGIWKNKYLWDLYKSAHTPYAWHHDAFKLAKKLNITLFSTPFSKKAVDFLEKFNVPIYKISSFEITDLDLINHIAKKNKPIILSTGMATLGEIKKAINIIEKHHKKIIILYCVSGYPTKEVDANIITIKKFSSIFKNYTIGLSDHTKGIYSSLTATALGVKVIEKHFILSNKLKSLDKTFSIEPKEMLQLKEMTKKVYQSLGKTIIGPKKNEIDSLKLRRSIFAIQTIKKGEKFSKKNIANFRPKIGICASKFFEILNKKTKKNIKKNEPLYYSDLK